ncbi:MAG: hypothetical protein IJD11_03205 [Oscillospiraceae bacterium]|nr:hypothetical protein [Oscillospiraceae bacterium]
MLTIYGTMLCPDCVEAVKVLDEKKIPYDYKNISESLLELKAFLKILATDPAFIPVKEGGYIGVPCFVREDGSVTLSLEEVL